MGVRATGFRMLAPELEQVEPLPVAVGEALEN
jgi:hypothetical protein